MNSSDTIVAVSSPPGRSPRGLIRVSGPACLAILGRLQAVTLPERPAAWRLGATRIRFGRQGPTLPVLLAVFAGPDSYTGQDMAEIQCPGHPALLERIVGHMLACGGRAAEPGEFTFRAVMAGKLDLTRAEGVAAMIAARSQCQLHAAQLLREGRLGRFGRRLVAALGDQLALVEAGIDFTDQEDVLTIGPEDLAAALEAIRGELHDLVAASRSWSSLEALPQVVLAGPPGCGKSSLFNALLGRRRALVSPDAGTTRDVLAEPVTCTSGHGHPVEVMLLDVAGLDHPVAALDRRSQAAARKVLRTADLVLCLDDGQGRQPAAGPVHQFTDGRAVLSVRSKADLAGSRSDGAQVAVSARTGAGLDRLRQLIVHRLTDRAISVTAGQLVVQPRHEAALRSALDHLDRARCHLRRQVTGQPIRDVELVAAAMRAALNELAALGGSLSPQEVIERVFDKFCIGK